MHLKLVESKGVIRARRRTTPFQPHILSNHNGSQRKQIPKHGRIARKYRLEGNISTQSSQQ